MMAIYNIRKIMNSSAFKTIVVRLTSDNIQEFCIDNEIFDDPMLEAATRAVELTSKTHKHSLIRAVMECWEKKTPNDPIVYNSYWLLVNAAKYDKAELLREKFKAQYDRDLKKEPLHGTPKRKPNP